MRLNLALGWLAAANLGVTVVMQWYVVTSLGLGLATDALFAGMVVPQLVLAVVAGSLMHVLVPLLAIEEGSGFGEVAWGLFLGVAALFTLVATLLFAGAGVWVGWLLPGFSEDAYQLTVTLTRIQLPATVFMAVNSVLWSAYHARRRFIWAELAPLLASLLALAGLILTLPRFGVAAAAWATVARGAVQSVLLLPGLGAWRRPDLTGPALREAWRRLRPLLAGATYYKADPLVDRFLSSMAPAGGLSTLYLGQQIWGALTQIINKAVAAPMVPVLALQAKEGRWGDFRSHYRRRLAVLGVLTGSGLVLFVLLGEPTLRLIIGRGGVTEETVTRLWGIMLALAGLFVGGTMGQITSAAFYAKGDTRTPTRLGMLTFTAYVPLKIAAFLAFGLPGVALATSLFFVSNLALQWRSLGAATNRAIVQ